MTSNFKMCIYFLKSESLHVRKLLLGKSDIGGSGVKIENWMSLMEGPCKLRMSCGQLEPKLLQIDQLQFGKISKLLSLNVKTICT